MTPGSRSQALHDRLLQAFDFAGELAAKEKEHDDRMRALLLSLLEVADSFDRFLADTERTEEPEPEQMLQWRLTFHRIGSQLQSTLQGADVRPVACLGSQANPELQEIVEVRPAAGVAEGVIVEEYLRGYEWNGRQLRHARVAVAAASKERKE